MAMMASKQFKYNSIWFYTALIIIAILLMGFYGVMVTAGDNPPHLNYSRVMFEGNAAGLPYPGQARTYPLYHFLVKVVAIVLGDQYEMAAMLVLTASNIGAIIAVRYVMSAVIISKNKKYTQYIIDSVAISSIFFETLRSGLTDYRFYARQCSANPWHNPTITFVRPFTILLFYFFLMLFLKLHTEEKITKELIQISILSLLVVLAKPSGIMTLLPAAGILTFIYWMTNFKKNLKRAMYILCSVLPAVFVIGMQYLVSVEIASVHFKFGSFSELTFKEVFLVSLATFPIPIITAVIGRKKIWKEKIIQLSYLMLLIGWFQMFFLTNGPSGDFSWGYDLAVGLSTVMALAYTLKEDYKKWQQYIVYILYGLQVVIGIQYIYLIWMGGGKYYF